jgi:hypothetical protein
MNRRRLPIRGLEAIRLPEYRRAIPRPRPKGFNDLADLSTDRLQTRLRAVTARLAVLTGKTAAGAMSAAEAKKLDSLSDAERRLAREEAMTEATALRNELRRRLAFLP